MNDHSQTAAHKKNGSANSEVVLETRGLVKSFGERPVLRELSLSVERGSTLVVLGLSGSGKTTLLKHCAGMLTADRGTVHAFGKNLATLDHHGRSEFRQRMGMVFQYAALLGSMTVLENVGLPLIEVRRLDKDSVRERVIKALKQVFLPAEEILDLKPANLSGGMRKRVGIARAVVQEPELLLYDEPTSGLDPVTARGVDNLILELQRAMGMSSLIISHDVNAALRIGDRIAMLHQGRIIAEGTPDQMRDSTHPAVRQLLDGTVDGPLTEELLRSTPQAEAPAS